MLSPAFFQTLPERVCPGGFDEATAAGTLPEAASRSKLIEEIAGILAEMRVGTQFADLLDGASRAVDSVLPPESGRGDRKV